MEFIIQNVQNITTAVSIIPLIDYFAGHETDHVKEHLRRSLELMPKYMHEKNQSEPWRNDWFPENQVSNNHSPQRLLEKTIKEIINDHEERKSEYIAKFWVNICLTSNSDIDEATAFSYLDMIESLSWRQLCIIHFVHLCENQEVEMTHIPDDTADDVQKWLEQTPRDEQTRFHEISRDFEKMMVDENLVGVRGTMVDGKPWLSRPSMMHPTYQTKRLYSLMNLHEIPPKEIEETFSPWNVRLKK